MEVSELRWEETFEVVCRKGNKIYNIDIGSIEFVEPLPEGFEWIEAYILWRSRQ